MDKKPDHINVNKKSDSVYVNYGGMVAVERPITIRNVQRVYVAVCLPHGLMRERECTSSRRGGGPCDDGGGEEGKKSLSRQSHLLRPFKYARRECVSAERKTHFGKTHFGLCLMTTFQLPSSCSR